MPPGNYRRESFEDQVGLPLSQLGDLKGAEEHYAASVGSQRTVERRTRTVIGARLAHDHAAIESFWGRIQAEFLNLQRWRTRMRLANAIFE
ncbi:hypothetical protein ACFOY4_41355 [Actinomadura syzygii]|uniref:Uncharacterized protein n=1 Tax=Actinomadura syzygii TaxID=1427538 RepID=A0A5D0TQG0_9ACTN|nr:hypothetical protein [Actinomadura syzygii]TYC07576.1 hypothetical protein FXF65_41960 [Actinomadura syzygii]